MGSLDMMFIILAGWGSKQYDSPAEPGMTLHYV